MIESLAKALEASKEILKKSSFDPDKRIQALDKDTVKKFENKSFDPNKRIEPSQKLQKSEKEKYDPDKRIETNDLSEYNDDNDKEVREPIQNKQDGLRREKEVGEELKEKYPEEDGYKIESEMYLRDKNGNIVKDPETREARRIDFVVTKDGKVVDSIEVTSKSADKTEQTAKEQRIRENGGNYIRDSEGNLIEIPKDITTRIERRD